MTQKTFRASSIEQLAEEAERQEELSKVARSQELDQSNSNRSSDSSHRSSSGSREQHHDNVEGIREEAPKTPVSARQESRSDEHLSAKTATSSSSSSSPSTTAAVVDGVTAPTSSGKESSNFPQEDAEVEAAMAMEHVRCLTESLCEESLRHHDLEVRNYFVLVMIVRIERPYIARNSSVSLLFFSDLRSIILFCLCFPSLLQPYIPLPFLFNSSSIASFLDETRHVYLHRSPSTHWSANEAGSKCRPTPDDASCWRPRIG